MQKLDKVFIGPALTSIYRMILQLRAVLVAGPGDPRQSLELFRIGSRKRGP